MSALLLALALPTAAASYTFLPYGNGARPKDAHVPDAAICAPADVPLRLDAVLSLARSAKDGNIWTLARLGSTALDAGSVALLSTRAFSANVTAICVICSNLGRLPSGRVAGRRVAGRRSM